MRGNGEQVLAHPWAFAHATSPAWNSFSPFLTHTTARSSSPFGSWLLCRLLRKPSAGCHRGLYWFLCHVFSVGISCEHPKCRSPRWGSRCCPSGWGPSFSKVSCFAKITWLVAVPAVAQAQACLTPPCAPCLGPADTCSEVFYQHSLELYLYLLICLLSASPH